MTPVLEHPAYGPWPMHRVRQIAIEDIEVRSSPEDGSFYTAGETIEVRVHFNDNVYYDDDTLDDPLDDPNINVKLSIGGNVRSAGFAGGGSGQFYLDFAYEVIAGDATEEAPVSVPAGGLGGGERPSGDPSGSDVAASDAVDLTHGAYGPFEGQYVNALPPAATVQDIRIVSSPGEDGVYTAGELLQLEVEFDLPVIAPVANMQIRFGTEDEYVERPANLDAAQDGRVLGVTRIIDAALKDDDGPLVPANSLVVPEGHRLTDAYGRDVVLAHRKFGPFEGHPVFTPEVTVEDIRIVSSPGEDNSYAAGDELRLEVEFSGPVTVPNLTELRLRIGTQDDFVAYPFFIGSGGDALEVLQSIVIVPLGWVDLDGPVVSANSLKVPQSQSITDAHGRVVTLAHDPYGPFEGHRVFTAPVTIADIRIESSPGEDGVYAQLGDQLTFDVEFDGPVTLEGGAGAVLTVQFGTGEMQEDRGLALAAHPSRDDVLRGQYKLEGELIADDGPRVRANAVTLVEGGSLADEHGRVVTLAHDPYGPFADHRVHIPPPAAVEDIRIASTPGEDEVYGAGESMEFEVVIDSASVSLHGGGAAHLRVRVDSAEGVRDEVVELTRSTDDHRVLVGSYEVAFDARDRDGVVVPANALTLPEGVTLVDAHRHAVLLAHPEYGPFGEHPVDTPEVGVAEIVIASTPGEDGRYEIGEELVFDVVFDGPVQLGGRQASLKS